ncbi:MAG: DNA repair protein RecO [Thermodesulfobacteriota bacterium]
MQTELSPAVILKAIPYGESDLLVFFFTPGSGRLKGIAKGARRSRKRFVNCLDVFSLVRLEFSTRRTGEFHLIQSGKLVNGFPGIRRDFATLSYASYMVELTEVLFPAGVSDPEVFDLLSGSLDRLSAGKERDSAWAVFEMRAMALGGFGLDFEACSVCGRAYTNEGRAVFMCESGGVACLGCRSETAHRPGLSPETVRAIRRVQAGPWEAVQGVEVSTEIVAELRPVLRLHREYRLERELRTARYILPEG